MRIWIAFCAHLIPWIAVLAQLPATGARGPSRKDDAILQALHAQRMWREWRVAPDLRLHVRDSTRAAVMVAELQAATRRHHREVLRTLGAARPPGRVDVVVVDTREDLGRLTGGPPRAGVTFAKGGVTVVRLAPDMSVLLRHELTHVVAHQLWGPVTRSQDTDWLAEGVAVWVGGNCARLTTREAAAFLLDTEALPTLAAMRGPFYRLPEVAAYVGGASIVAYVAERHGRAALAPLWRDGLDTFVRTRGIALPAFERGWREYLRATPLSDTLRARAAGGCLVPKR